MTRRHLLFSKHTLCILLIVALAGCDGGSDGGSGGDPDAPAPGGGPCAYFCSVYQGFHFDKTDQAPVGHVNSLKIGDQTIGPDVAVTDPRNITGDHIKVFGVLSYIYWEGGIFDPIQFSCQVSAGNKDILLAIINTGLSDDTEVLFEFTVYNFDPDAKKYYKAFHSGQATLEGLILKQDGELAISIDTEALMEVVSPENFAFQLGVVPQDKNQELHVEVSDTDKFVKPWGAPAYSANTRPPIPLTLGRPSQ